MHPERIRVGPLMNYGYSGHAYLPYRLSVPEQLDSAGPVRLAADVDWLVCEEVCIPESGRVTLSLPVAGATTPADGLRSAEFDRIRAAQPRPSPWPARLEPLGDAYRLVLQARGLDASRIEDAWFYPTRYGVIEHAAAQALKITAEDLSLSLTPAIGAPPDPAELAGVLVLKERLDGTTVTQSFELSAVRSTTGGPAEGLSLTRAWLLALIGGLILNLMPCVFPVLSMKALALTSLVREAPRRVRWHGLVFTAGVLVSFAALAGILMGLRAGGEQIGWGFQLQSPGFVLALAWLMFGLGLMFSGVLTVGGRLAGIGEGLTRGGGPGSAFFTGVLAVVVATPCTAPFMGAALGYALTQPPTVGISVFLALGLGMAAPWLALSLWPALHRHLPRPGPWMERLKQFLAFPLYATAAWLIWVLSQQAGSEAIAAALAGMVLLAFAAWLWQQTRSVPKRWRRLGRLLSIASAATLVVLLGVTGSGPLPETAPTSARSGSLHWEPYSGERLESLRAEGRPVFVNFTAAWCITCLVNERVALSSEPVAEMMREKGVAYLKGDWTNRDPIITEVLTRHGRSGVPLYLLYPPDRSSAPEVLPQLLTEGMVLERLRRL
jgi:thiol:disulfide interchange protein DsbD